MAKVTNKIKCRICDKKFGRSDCLKIHVKTVHDGIKDHQCKFCNKKFGRLGHMNRHVKEIHDGKSRSQSLKCKKQVETAQKGSKNAKDSKRMKILEKEALDFSNIAGFDHENKIDGEVPKIKKEIKHEVKIEPVDEGSKNDPVDETVHDGPKTNDSKILKIKEEQALDVSNIAGFDYENQIVGEEHKIKK